MKNSLWPPNIVILNINIIDYSTFSIVRRMLNLFFLRFRIVRNGKRKVEKIYSAKKKKKILKMNDLPNVSAKRNISLAKKLIIDIKRCVTLLFFLPALYKEKRN